MPNMKRFREIMAKPNRGTLRSVEILRGSRNEEVIFVARGVDETGTLIRTSYIVGIDSSIIETRNSIYHVESWTRGFSQLPYSMSQAQRKRMR